MTRGFDVFFDLRLNKRLSKQSWGWWFETLSRPLWRHRNDYHLDFLAYLLPDYLVHHIGYTCWLNHIQNSLYYHYVNQYLFKGLRSTLGKLTISVAVDAKESYWTNWHTDTYGTFDVWSAMYVTPYVCCSNYLCKTSVRSIYLTIQMVLAVFQRRSSHWSLVVVIIFRNSFVTTCDVPMAHPCDRPNEELAEWIYNTGEPKILQNCNALLCCFCIYKICFKRTKLWVCPRIGSHD